MLANKKFFPAFKRLTLLGATAAAALASTGCSWLTIGEENFSCSGMPDSAQCMNARDMYYQSLKEEQNPVVATGANQAVQGIAVATPVLDDNGKPIPDSDKVTKLEGKVIIGDDEIVQNFVTPRLPYAPVPIRTPAMVMRIWVAPYEDVNGDLMSPGYIFTEVEARKWVSAPNNAKQQKHFEPLVRYVQKESENDGPRKNNLELLKEKREQKSGRK